MNDEQMQPLLDGWLRDRETPRPEVRTGVAKVMADVPRTRQQGRWWPLPAFDRPRSTSPIAARGFTMFSALKLLTAGAIVALFGGFLLTGFLTAPDVDEAAPGAMTESPSPMTTAELLSGMRTEEVEPGVLRVLNDGVRDIVLGGVSQYPSVLAGHDGSVWLHTGTEGEVFQLGNETTYPLDDEACPSDGSGSPCHPRIDGWPFWLNPVDSVVTPGGTMWTRFFGSTPGLYAFDGERWITERPTKQFDALATGPDGRVWAVWQGSHVGRVDGEWETITDTPDGYSGLTPDGNEYSAAGGLTVTDDGSIWLWPQNTWFWGSTDPTYVYRYDGESWESFGLPDGDTGHVVVGQDGTVWWSSETDKGVDSRPTTAIYRFDGREWERFDAADDWPDLLQQWTLKRLEVAPDGRLWVLPWDIPLGPVLFDGDEWTEYLPSHVVFASDMAPDGSVWAIAAEYPADDDAEELRPELYVITAKAVVANG